MLAPDAEMELDAQSRGHLPFLAPHLTDMLLAQDRSTQEIRSTIDLRMQTTMERVLGQYLRTRSDVASVERVAPEQALAQLRQRDDLAAAIDALGEDAARAALPQALRVTPRDDERALLTVLGPRLDRAGLREDAALFLQRGLERRGRLHGPPQQPGDSTFLQQGG